MTTASPIPSTPPAATPKMSGLAIASLVCGLAAVCLVGLPGIPGVILGIIALLKISKSEGRLRGQGLAIAGIVVSALTVLMIPVTAALLLPAVFRAKAVALDAMSLNNVKQLGAAAQMYGNDNGDKLPPAADWPTLFQQRYSVTASVLADPAAPGEGRAYAMNAAVTHLAVLDPARTVLFFECRPGSPPAGGPELLPEEPRHGSRYIIGFIDGHAEAVSPDAVKGLIWQPQK